MEKKNLNISDVNGAKKNISDLQVFGDGDTWLLLCKASSQSQGWMKSTKVLPVAGVGCFVQVTTQQTSPDGSYAVAESVTFAPGVKLIGDGEERKLVPIGINIPTDENGNWTCPLTNKEH